jgi:diaminopimelate decarboxylase
MSDVQTLPTTVEQQVLSLAQAQDGEPLCAYLYDLHALRQHVRKMVDALPENIELFYAAKANPEPEILATLAPFVTGFEAASGGELAHLEQQQLNKPLIFGGPGKLPSELKLALNLGIDAIHVESLTELRRIGELTIELEKDASVYLRMNIDIGEISLSKLAMGGKPTPFGLDENDLPVALHILRDYPRIQLKGFHFHLMSHQLSVERHLALIERYFSVVKQWQQQFGLGTLAINLGGGMGINYLDPQSHFPWLEFCEKLQPLIVKKQMQDWQLRFECGRFVSAGCGYYIMEVLDVKENLGETFVIGRGGTHHFRTPAAQSHHHPFAIVRRALATPGIQSVVTDRKVTLVGQLCTPKDVLARQQAVDRIAIGDYVVFTLAGAYAWNISHQNFLMHEPPLFHFMDR